MNTKQNRESGYYFVDFSGDRRPSYWNGYQWHVWGNLGFYTDNECRNPIPCVEIDETRIVVQEQKKSTPTQCRCCKKELWLNINDAGSENEYRRLCDSCIDIIDSELKIYNRANPQVEKTEFKIISENFESIFLAWNMSHAVEIFRNEHTKEKIISVMEIDETHIVRPEHIELPLKKDADKLVSMLEDVVTVLDLSDFMIEKHGEKGTEPADLVREVLERKDLEISMLKKGMVDLSSVSKPSIEKTREAAKKIVQNLPSVKQGLDNFYGETTVVNAMLDFAQSTDTRKFTKE